MTRLATNTADDWFPSWSPDESKIAFASDRSGNADIWIMTLGGITNAEPPKLNPTQTAKPIQNTTPVTPAFEAVIAIIGLLTIAYLIRRKI